MNPLQKAAVRRKAYYLGAILALFTLSMFWRGMIDVPLGNAARAAEGGSPSAAHWVADQLAARSIQNQASRLELRELEQGDPEILGTVVRLLLTGSRGVAVTALWYDAIEKQKRNDFHEFELRVRAVTTLQPHFITPWIFQSWNITYNVSVEMQSIGDMYFYIARGIELLSEGERRNKRSPDMRYQIGFYYQNKFGVSDQVQTLRCLFQLSCIPTNERDPSPGNGLTTADGSVDAPGFQAFCEKHPMLVRRLRGEERRDTGKKSTGETLLARTPDDVIDFLRTNLKVPSRYRVRAELAEADKQFPVLPPPFNEGPDEFKPATPSTETFSGYLAARAWFTYANALIPPNPRDETGNPVPSATPKPGTGPGDYDPFKYRVPRLPMLIIFRQGPPRAQTYQAELMQKDGWFDGSGWDVDAGIDDSNAWFTEDLPGGGRRKRSVVIGAGHDWSRAAWEEAARMWRKHGEDNALILDPARRERLREEAGVLPGAPDNLIAPPDMTPEQREDARYARWHRANEALFYYHHNRQVTNFPYYLASAEAEQQRETVQARKVLWQADQARRNARNQEAVRLYEEGLRLWQQVLLKNPAFHRPERFDRAEEETYEYELEYLRLLALTDKRVTDKTNEVVRAAAGVVPFLGEPYPADRATPLPPWSRDEARERLRAAVAERFFAPFGGLMPADLPPSDGRAGTPWIRQEVKDMVLARQGVTAQKPPSQPVPVVPGENP